MHQENWMAATADITCLADDRLYEMACKAVAPERRQKAARLQLRADRWRCIGAGLLLNRMVARFWEQPDSLRRDMGILNVDLIKELSAVQPCFDLAISYNLKSKPYFTGHPELFFNLSHAGDFVACAVSRAPVGIDIEGSRPYREKVAERFFSPQERAWMADGAPAQRFFALWTLKEAYAKAVGIGIGQGIGAAHFRQDPAADGGEKLAFAEPELAGRYTARTFRQQGYSIAVVCEKRDFDLRKYQPEDCPAMIQLFVETVQAVNIRNYTQMQIDAWAGGKMDAAEWNRSFLAHETVVAVRGQTLVGFGDLAADGYLDRLYVHRDFQGRGIARAICDWLEMKYAGTEITTHASVTAQPFFEKRGYQTVSCRQVERNRILLTQYVMRLKKQR